MLSNEAIDAALPLAQRLDAKGLYLEAVAGSPLDRLINATRIEPTSVAVASAGGGYEIATDAMAAPTNVADSITHINLHDTCQDEIAASAIKTMQAHLMVARTLVAPAVDQLVQDVQTRLKTLPASDLLGMEVKLLNESSLFRSAAFIGMVEKFRDVPSQPPALAMKLPDMDSDQIIELLATGVQSVDNEIKVWAKMLGESYLQSLFQGLFQTKDVVFEDFESAMYDRVRGADAAIMAFLGGRKLAEEVAIDGIEMSREKLVELALQYRNQAAARLCTLLDIRQRDAKNGNLVVSTAAKQVTVNESVYRQWLAAGGQNEVLFGMLLRDRPLYTARDLEENKDDCLKAWAGYVTLQTTAEGNARFNGLVSILNSTFRESLDYQREGDCGPDLNANNRALVLQRFESEMADVCLSDFEQLDLLCLRLVCRTRFATTDAEKFLLKMVELQKQNPELKVTEVATFAAVDYLADWVASQTLIKQ